MQLTDLNAQFSIPGLLRFEMHDDLTVARVTLPNCAADLYLHGAHVTHFQPTGSAPILFLSGKSDFAANKPIRGGIPLCFPWFGTRSFGPHADTNPGPTHGFARTQEWTLAAAALVPDKSGGAGELHLTLTLAPSELSRSLGFDHFRAAYEVILGHDGGRTLTVRLTVANLDPAKDFHFEEALHSYFEVADIHQVELTGLESAAYLDKTDSFKSKTTPASPLKLTSRTDRVFPGASGAVTIHDEAAHRTITNTKTASATTVVWNPWSDGTAAFTDIAADDWLHFVCVETANVAANAITLAPNQTHTMQTTITLHP